MEKDNPIEQIMETAMNKLRTLVDVNTVIGSPITCGNDMIIVPFSKVSMGFVAGGGEYADPTKSKPNEGFPFAGGSGAGLCVTPIGFLVFDKNKVKIVNMEDKSSLLKMLEDVPNVIKSIIEKIGKEEK